MSESEHPADESHKDTAKPAEPTEFAEPLEDEAGPPIDPDVRTGFSFEQRRFLWTIAGVNIIAILLAAAIIVGYQAAARSQDAAVVRLGDQYESARTNYENEQQRQQQGMGLALLAGQTDTYKERRQELVDAYRDAMEKRAQWRRARGLDAEDVSPEQLEAFGKQIDDRVAHDVEAFQASTRPATQPATAPDKTKGAASKPAK